ncbi:MAG: carbohydrate-binding domain-containing protein, partial [Clostridia bacterium]|nr:carbohydrate-binding domain-containing protein [Clostridia bacterium]
MKKFLSILMIIVTVIGMLSGCSSTTETSKSAKSEDEVVTVELDESAYVTADGDVLTADLEALVQDAITKNYPDESETATTEIDLSKESDVVNIRNGGTYVLTGEFDGQIFVDTDDEDVQLILAGVTLTNDDDAPIYIMSADEATITLKSGTTNTIVNTSVYMEDDGTDVERANGAIYSKADLAINGDGSLEIVANNKTAILGKDDVVILSGHIKVSSERNGIKGKDLLYIGDVDLEIESGKAGLNSEVVVYIDGSEININDSYEGIESYDIMIKDGLVNIVASDDGINIANPDESSSMGGGFGMPGSNGQTSTHGLRIYGGSVNINSNGDGLDSNASIWMTGGLVTVSGPTSNGNGSLDYDQTFTLDGGILIAVGSLGMVQTPSDTSS